MFLIYNHCFNINGLRLNHIKIKKKMLRGTRWSGEVNTVISTTANDRNFLKRSLDLNCLPVRFRKWEVITYYYHCCCYYYYYYYYYYYLLLVVAGPRHLVLWRLRDVDWSVDWPFLLHC